MGFFSSRKPEQAGFLEDDRSVVQVIRSRFYGKYKGKGREVFPNTVSSPQPSRFGSKSQKPTSRESQPHTNFNLSPRSPLRPLEQSSPRSVPRAHTDTITSTLAQRLNELAAANAQGLLDDEEYRLLRQNIFERLASGSSVPTENPVIPFGSHTRPPHQSSQLNLDSYVPPQFQVKSSKTPSVRSKSSVSSTMSNLFKRGSTRRISATSTNDGIISETSSTFSLGSVASNAFKRGTIPRNMRGDSPSFKMGTPVDHGAMLSPSRPNGMGHHPLGSASYRSISRSMRRLGTATPPSSFPSRNPELKRCPSILTSDPPPDDEKVKSSQDIRLEIEAMEAEGQRLLDAFNGLELTALTRGQYKPGHPPVPHSPSVSAIGRRNGGEYNDSFLTAGGSTSGRGTPYHGSDADGISLRSTTSYGTNVSQSRPHLPNRALRTNGALAAPVAEIRKRSMSSLSSRARAPQSTSSPTLTQARLRDLGSVSSVNLVKLHGPISATLMDEDAGITALETELIDIRRRRQDVTARYQDRLEYLRAQLKGAELREKLLRK
ncbi:hypothetical protein PAXRUDRAFT_137547 [Paxillus rubicundulus Ve08.2h10]|uniref:Uncharacterized protein n=1 Tax=Paxillus rubicundulus Ve08.2h10 TaxID=930991 RepID=A0A0D0DG87_9AGAM|nr:hypothetical protein PAXRUDRAFT_137547 [Paxillus rubicundulus Ve08.2h10]